MRSHRKLLGKNCFSHPIESGERNTTLPRSKRKRVIKAAFFLDQQASRGGAVSMASTNERRRGGLFSS